jgi:trans-aconitate methyltransferase
MLAVMSERREIARSTFDSVAALYDEARPGYPQAVYRDLIHLARLAPDARLLEIGSGTGHATLPLAQQGFRIDGVELGEQMAAVARTRLAAFPAVSITVADFDHWSASARYDLVFAASSYHWLNPAIRVRRIAALLAPGGHIAVFRNHHVATEATAAFNHAVQRIYASTLGPQYSSSPLPCAGQIAPVEAAEWTASGLFVAPDTRIYQWRQRLSAAEYVQQLATHSDHRMLPEHTRDQLFDNLQRLIDDEFSGAAEKDYATLLQVAEKIP